MGKLNFIIVGIIIICIVAVGASLHDTNLRAAQFREELLAMNISVDRFSMGRNAYVYIGRGEFIEYAKITRRVYLTGVNFAVHYEGLWYIYR